MQNDWDRGGILYKNLRHSGKKYKKYSTKVAGLLCIPGRGDIPDRPAIVENKEEIGSFEGDDIIGAGHCGIIISVVERHSKLTYLVKAPKSPALS